MQITLEQSHFPVQTSPKKNIPPKKDKNKNSEEGSWSLFQQY